MEGTAGFYRRILVCGGRDFNDTSFIYNTLDGLLRINPIEVVIEGDARGVDRIAGYWARKNNLINLKFRADWVRYGKSAGYIRNRQMLDEGLPDLVVAFPGGKGTESMIRIARQKPDVSVMEVEYLKESRKN